MIIRGDARALPLRVPMSQIVVTKKHDRKRKPFWDRDWLVREYIENGRSSTDIARQFGVRDSAVQWWFKKHKVPVRTTAETRAIKHWGLSGTANPMFGRTGAANPNYRDGRSPERQRIYAQARGREFLKTVHARDGCRCVRCGSPKHTQRVLHVHHIEPWAENESKRLDLSNAVTLCRSCHRWVHSEANIAQEYLVRR